MPIEIKEKEEEGKTEGGEGTYFGGLTLFGKIVRNYPYRRGAMGGAVVGLKLQYPFVLQKSKKQKKERCSCRAGYRVSARESAADHHALPGI